MKTPNIIEEKKKRLLELRNKNEELRFLSETPILHSKLKIAIYTDAFNSKWENESIKKDIEVAFRYDIDPTIVFIESLEDFSNGKYDILVIDYGGLETHGLDSIAQDNSLSVKKILDNYNSVFILFTTIYTHAAYNFWISQEIKNYSFSEFDLNRINIMDRHSIKWKQKIAEWFD